MNILIKILVGYCSRMLILSFYWFVILVRFGWCKMRTAVWTVLISMLTRDNRLWCITTLPVHFCVWWVMSLFPSRFNFSLRYVNVSNSLFNMSALWWERAQTFSFIFSHYYFTQRGCTSNWGEYVNNYSDKHTVSILDCRIYIIIKWLFAFKYLRRTGEQADGEQKG